MAPDGVGRLRVLTYNFLCHYDPAIAHPLCIPHSLGLKPETTVCTSRMALGEVKNAQVESPVMAADSASEVRKSDVLLRFPAFLIHCQI